LADGVVVAAAAADVVLDDASSVGGVDAALILSANDCAALLSLSLLATTTDSDDGEELLLVAVDAIAIRSRFFFLDARASCSAKLIIIFVVAIFAKAPWLNICYLILEDRRRTSKQ
jgi:hypothetical protein